ncbi:hypothetical protein E8K88_03955 [Lampropedia aestuarii]|uniref:Uncharacterized protein n=1 Tax=Lampropedia aestuarii TaxID=2562762 RepID=A0A4S5BYQ0_9BURK|nr:hypothetical protein [Lampropedia aestuarii]MDH5858872.1 hypothetical protein [Lampropedia aestuarii]THJ35166.1 hypothetical protein E8K88_03955 [Lampropedia aestuarii]
MKSHHIQLFADHFQFYLKDERVPGNLSEAWNRSALQRMLAVSDGVVGISTVRNTAIPVTLELLDAAPETDLAEFDHVAEASLVITNGPLVVAGCRDYFPDAPRFDVSSGTYQVRLSASGLRNLSEDGMNGDDHYLLQLWQAPFREPITLKQAS